MERINFTEKYCFMEVKSKIVQKNIVLWKERVNSIEEYWFMEVKSTLFRGIFFYGRKE